jgi:hypothetical protein
VEGTLAEISVELVPVDAAMERGMTSDSPQRRILAVVSGRWPATKRDLKNSN